MPSTPAVCRRLCGAVVRPLTRRGPTRALACAVVVVGLGGLAGCGGPQVTLTLTRNEGLAVAPEFVRFVFHMADEDVEAGPFGITAIPAESFAAVPPPVSFSIDVIGCLKGVREECEDPTSFVGRGCAGPFSRDRDTDLAITVELLPTVEGNALCPIAP